MTKAVQQNPDRVGTWVKSTTQRRFGRAAAGARGAAGRAGTGFPLAGPVVRTVLPGPAPTAGFVAGLAVESHRTSSNGSARQAWTP